MKNAALPDREDQKDLKNTATSAPLGEIGGPFVGFPPTASRELAEISVKNIEPAKLPAYERISSPQIKLEPKKRAEALASPFQDIFSAHEKGDEKKLRDLLLKARPWTKAIKDITIEKGNEGKLQIAIILGLQDVVEKMCREGFRFRIGVNPMFLGLAIFGREFEIAKSLVKQEPLLLDEVDSEYNQMTPIHVAALCGDERIGEWLISKKSKFLNIKSSAGMTPFYLAAQEGHMAFAQMLYKKDKDVLNIKTADRRRPIHAAASNGHLEMLKWLFQLKKSTLKKLSSSDWSPLHHAAFGGHVPAVRWILEQDSSLQKKKDTKGHTALDVAREARKSEVVDFLENPQYHSL